MNRSNHRVRRGFSLVELFVVIAILGILFMFMVPAVRTSGSASRRSFCMSNQRQVMLSLLNYESSCREFPAAMGGGKFGDFVLPVHAQQLSGLVAVLPYLEQPGLWEEVSALKSYAGVDYPAFPDPNSPGYPAWNEEVRAFQCPASDKPDTPYGHTNYVFSIGDVARDIHHPSKLRGAFAVGMNSKLEDFKDGTSCTIALTEIATLNGNHSRSNYAVDQPAALLDSPGDISRLLNESSEFASHVSMRPRGSNWADGAAGPALVNTILPPFSPSAAILGRAAADGLYSASSYHGNAVVVSFADGSVHSVAKDIDAGDAQAPTLTSAEIEAGAPTPYGVWGALGTLASNDDTQSFDW